MNIYEDYINYLNECSDVLEKLYEIDSPILICLDDVIKVTDYVYQLYLDNKKISDELAEIFELGFGYLANSLADIKTYFVDFFNNDIELLNTYSSIIIYAIYIEDYKCYLTVNDLLNDERRQTLEAIAYNIEKIMANRLPYDEQVLKEYDEKMDNITPLNDNFKPVYLIFSLVKEELEIYK